MNEARGWSLATFVFGLATFAILIGFGLLPEVKAAYPDGDFGQQLSAFQRASSMADLTALFGDPADPAKLEAMSAGNTLDLYGFIPAYSLFLISGAAMLAGGLRKRIGWFAIAAALVGAVADIMETYTQLEMTSDWSSAEDLLVYVAPSSWTKFFALALHGAGCGLICFFGAKKRFLVGLLGVTPVIGVGGDYFGLIHVPQLMSMVFGAFWLALLAVAITQPVRAPSAPL